MRLVPLLALAAVVVALIGAVVGYRAWDHARKGVFDAAPRACGLISGETVHRLVPENLGERPGQKEICTWSTPKKKGSSRTSPWIHVLAFRTYVAGAKEGFRSSRDEELGWERDSVQPLRGIGDEAYLRFRRDLGGSVTAEITFRRSNVVVHVQYARADDDRTAARAGVLEAATEAGSRL